MDAGMRWADSKLPPRPLLGVGRGAPLSVGVSALTSRFTPSMGVEALRDCQVEGAAV